MATRVIKLREAEQPAPGMGQEVLSQSKRPEVGRFLLQVDRQTKQSYATAEAAEMAGMVIKKGHPIVRVSVYDSVETANKIIELPAGSSVARAIPLSAGLSDAAGSGGIVLGG
jgi:hypothetical protein